MDKRAFGLLFRTAVERALQEAGVVVTMGDPIIEFHGGPNPQNPIGIEEATDLLWVSSTRFYFIVDVGVLRATTADPVIFVRPSGHEPRPFAATWDPDDLGPFKVFVPLAAAPGE